MSKKNNLWIFTIVWVFVFAVFSSGCSSGGKTDTGYTGDDAAGGGGTVPDKAAVLYVKVIYGGVSPVTVSVANKTSALQVAEMSYTSPWTGVLTRAPSNDPAARSGHVIEATVSNVVNPITRTLTLDNISENSSDNPLVFDFTS